MRSGIHLKVTQALDDSQLQYLEGHGDLVNALIMGILGVVIWLIRVINLLTKSP